jgi:site-specific DNA-methyltransferase (adenine-specific)
VDVVVTDPPAGIGFMGKAWDSFKNYDARTARGREVAPILAELGLERWARGFVVFLVDIWTAVDRVMKPGALCCAWALPKTADLAGLAMRLVGWTIHESVLHLFGGGMNKSGDIGKKIDKAAGAEREVLAEVSGGGRMSGDPDYQSGAYGGAWHGHKITAPATEAAKRWTGWHSQIAPGAEYWLIGQKPGRLTYDRQLVERGCGAFNVDACRVPRGDKAKFPDGVVSDTEQVFGGGGGMHGDRPRGGDSNPSGSHPRNVVLSTGGPGCPARGLDRQSGVTRDGGGSQGGNTCFTDKPRGGKKIESFGGQGGASRYFTRFDERVGYHPKVKTRDVPLGHERNPHNCVKNLRLMRWLVRLMAATAEHTGGAPAVVLDPFAGSMTTGVACIAEGVDCIMIERDPAHFEVGRARVLGAIGSPEFAAEANERAPEGAQLGLL